MSHHSNQEWIISWLNDAHALESSLAKVLQNHANDAKNHPEVQQRLLQHMEITKRQADMIENRIKALGGSVSQVKEGLGIITGMMQNLPSGWAKDEIVKNALSDYMSEHFEIASYTSLIAASEAAGDTETAQMCRQFLREEQEMAQWLEQQIPTITTMFLGQQAREHGA